MRGVDDGVDVVRWVPIHGDFVMRVLAALMVLVCVGTSASGAAAPRVALWPQGAPGAKGQEEKDQPWVDVYQPRYWSTGTAVVVCPGGGYGGLAADHEGQQVAQWLNTLGVTAFVLHYRLGTAGYHHPIQMGDGQRAIRLVRANAERYKIDPTRIGVMGFSAGGHMASTLATHFDDGKLDAADAVERVSSRPDFAVICYAVITMTQEPYVHKGSRKNLLGPNESDAAMRELMSNEKQVTARTPPCFLFHTDEDTGVPSENSVLFYQALRANKVPGELHVFRPGRHGVGLAPGDPWLSHWPGLLANWMKANGWLEVVSRAAPAPTKKK
jgi:acetyl esterase/lipase